MRAIELYESEVRGYCRSFPTVFTQGRGSILRDASGREFLDFFAGAGALNYGHNHPALKQELLEYLAGDGVVHSLDMVTEAKCRFLERFNQVILAPRGLNYKVQFTGPTGTNSVEAALKLARKVTGRTTIVSFTNAFHGMTLGSLSVTGNRMKRQGAAVPLTHTVSMPFDNYMGDGVDTLDYFEAYLNDGSSGLDKPAAVIVETVQAEGGINVASIEWLRKLRKIADDHQLLLIVDDIQVGCGRTGPFFSFERANIKPDMVCLSKSLSGYGLPFAITLFRPELDVWAPGEHNGTFRGHNPAFVTATAALNFWEHDDMPREVATRARLMRDRLVEFTERFDCCLEPRGLGLIQGVACTDGVASRVSQAAFQRGLIIETAGPKDEVLKLLPALNIDTELLDRGIDILEESFVAVTGCKRSSSSHPSSEVTIQA